MKDIKDKTMAKFAYSFSLVFKMLICSMGAAYLMATGGDATTLLIVSALSLVFLPLAVYAESQM
jgi:hypothetical protein